MNVKVTEKEKNQVELEFTVSAVDFDAAVQKAYLKQVKQINMPGFRKGKAPRKMIEQIYGEGVFFEEAVNIVLPESYDAALTESGIDAVSRPDVDVKDIGAGKDLVLTALVYTKPDAVVTNYKGLSIDKIEYPVTDEDIDKDLAAMQNKNARIITVEDEAASLGDTTIINFEGFVDGEAFEGGKGENYTLELGSKMFIPGFEEQLVGVKIGEEVEVNVSFPEQYHAEELKGKPALFKVTINEIKKKELPELNDDFAKDFSEFENLDALKADIRTRLETSAATRQKRETDDAIVDAMLENVTVEIPDAMIEGATDNMVRDFEMRISQQGMKLEQYMQYTGMDMEAFRTQFKDEALKQVKTSLALEAIAKNEKLELSDEDLEKELARMAEQYKMEIEQVKEYFAGQYLETFKKDLLNSKALEFITENAKIGQGKKAVKKSKKVAEETSAE